MQNSVSLEPESKALVLQTKKQVVYAVKQLQKEMPVVRHLLL